MLKCFYDTSTDTAVRSACCGSFVGNDLGVLDARYRETRWRRRFTWFGPPERNILCPRKILCCIAIGRLKALVVVEVILRHFP
jgi:hypothetical protein